MKKIRCAIYTRKSSEEGLEQEFNSLDAQREACALYIVSQKHEGWVLLPDHYDDGGISGGTLERAALTRLMQQVDEGSVDQIVVYKIDRLTRSLADFAKLVDRLDRAGASFVSVTQSFNTATSMGRLTLNVLLSFAQFEREVTAERIRDKIAASKKKGLWMGGTVPLGYEADGRTLKIVRDEAKTVQRLYVLYREHRTVTATTHAARQLRLRSKRRANGRGGNTMGRGHVHAILTNPIYAGYIRHKQTVHPGLHQPIIDPAEWEEVQQLLKMDARRGRQPCRSSRCAIPMNEGAGTADRNQVKTAAMPSNGSLLVGKLYDETGDRLTPSHANKNGRRYRYYVSNRLIAAKSKNDRQEASSGWRLPAPALEEQLALAVSTHLRDVVLGNLHEASSIDEMLGIRRKIDELTHAADRIGPCCTCIDEAHIEPGRIRISLDPDAAYSLLELNRGILPHNECWTFNMPFTLRRRGVEARIVIGDGGLNNTDPALIDNLARAHHILSAIKQGADFAAISCDTNISVGRIKQLLPLAFLAPDITRDIVLGRQPAALTVKWLEKKILPSDWDEQRKALVSLV